MLQMYSSIRVQIGKCAECQRNDLNVKLIFTQASIRGVKGTIQLLIL